MRDASEWVVTELRTSDRDAWERLYCGYAEHYETAMPPQKLARVWEWLHDPAHELSAYVVRADDAGPAVGLAHYRPFSRPLAGSVGLYLDDLFVDPSARGRGAVDALLAALRERAAAEGWSVVRWITKEDNLRARRVYDREATKTDFVTYDMPPQ